jgi:hypothetical protein
MFLQKNHRKHEKRFLFDELYNMYFVKRPKRVRKRLTDTLTLCYIIVTLNLGRKKMALFTEDFIHHGLGL